MKKIAVVVVLLMVCLLAMVGCTNGGEPTATIVYLGDSIAEGLAGPSPLFERSRYAYYGVLGIRNNFETYNRSVSGHLSRDLIKILEQDDFDARVVRTRIKEADVIHISILGNDLLLRGLGPIILDEVRNDGTYVLDPILEESKTNIDTIIDLLREQNKEAYIVFQAVYNPAHPDSVLIDDNTREELVGEGVLPKDYHNMANGILTKLNKIPKDASAKAKAAGDDKILVVDAQAEFNRIYEEDEVRGARLIYNDGVHPSSEGHAVLADLNQELLLELGIGKTKSKNLKMMKELRLEQLNRLYGHEGSGVDLKATRSAIKKAKTDKDLTKAYFDAVYGKKPVYGEGSTFDTNKNIAEKDIRPLDAERDITFSIDIAKTTVWDDLSIGILLDQSNTYARFNSDGTATIRIQLQKDIAGFLSALKLDLSGIDLQSFIDSMLWDYFPGLDTKDMEGSLELLKTIGLSLNGLDKSTPRGKELLEVIEATGKLPAELVLPTNPIYIEYNVNYYVKEVTSHNGTKYKGLFLGGHEQSGEPFIIMTVLDEDKDDEDLKEGKRKLTMRVEVVRLSLVGYER